MVVYTILSLGLIIFLLNLLKPKAEESEQIASGYRVDVLVVHPENVPVEMLSFGSVEPQRELDISSEVNGLVVYKSENLVKGGTVSKGEVLWEVDQTNYNALLEQAKGNLERAQLELEIEKGRQQVAKQDWEMISEEVKEEFLDSNLALRVPHLKEKEAAVLSAKSQLSKALKDLERTKVYSPFNAVVVSENIEEGKFLTVQQPVAKLVASDAFNIETSIPLDYLNWLDLDKNNTVMVRQNIGIKKIEMEGKILRLLSDLDSRGRMARLLIAIDDPLRVQQGSDNKFPFLLGTFVEIEIIGNEVENVYQIPRTALRENNIVWTVAENDSLKFNKVDPVYKTEESVYIKSGLSNGEKVVLTTIPTAFEGMPVIVRSTK